MSKLVKSTVFPRLGTVLKTVGSANSCGSAAASGRAMNNKTGKRMYIGKENDSSNERSSDKVEVGIGGGGIAEHSVQCKLSNSFYCCLNNCLR